MTVVIKQKSHIRLYRTHFRWACESETLVSEFETPVPDTFENELLQSNNSDNPAYSAGPAISMGNGLVHTYTLMNPIGKPLEIGIYFDAGALEGLPTSISDGLWDVLDADGNIVHPCCGHEHFLEFPSKVLDATAFQYAIVNWNPQGHIPPGIYDVPHFDFHFYTFSNEERLSIEAPALENACRPPDHPAPFVPLTCEVYTEAMLPLPTDQQPPDYVNVGAIEPGMGNHLLDFNSQEWIGEPFTQTFIFGSYGGKLTFWEPMITLAYFEGLVVGKKGETGPKQSIIPIKMPAAAPKAGWYPSKYLIRYMPSSNAFSVSLKAFQWLPESQESS